MTPLKKPVTRRGNAELDGSYGKDRARRLVVTLLPGTGDVPDCVELRPEGTRRTEVVALCDVYRYAVRARANRENLERARKRKASKDAAKERRALDRMARKVTQPLK